MVCFDFLPDCTVHLTAHCTTITDIQWCQSPALSGSHRGASFTLSDYWLLSLSLNSQTGEHGSALLQALVWRRAPKRHRAAYFILTVANILPPPPAADNWQVLFFRRILCHCLVPVARHHLQHQPQQKRRSTPTTMDLSLTLCYLLIRFVVPITLGAGKCYIFFYLLSGSTPQWWPIHMIVIVSSSI